MAGTDYALLLVSRFREELRREESRFAALRFAWRASFEPIVASAGTVILGLLCLLVSDLASNRGGVAALMAIRQACDRASWTLILSEVSPFLRRVLDMAGLSTWFGLTTP